MNVLVITGKKAENAVRISTGNDADVLVLDIEIAAFITPALLQRSLPFEKYDLILLPGLASGDFSRLEKEINTPIRLGPKHAFDLGFVLSFAEVMDFSSKVPACEILLEKRRMNAFEKIDEIEERSISPLTVKGLKIGGNTRMKVMAEVVDAGHLEKEELTRRIVYFFETGADIIDLGISLDTTTQEVKNAVEIARSIVSIPLSIDTLDPDHINAALDSGVDIVLSLNSRNINEVKKNVIRNSAVAVIIPDCAQEIESLFNNIGFARNSGIEKILADPVLEPVGHGLAGSICRYFEFRRRDHITPLFFGAGNVSELIDADSVGVNAMLAGMAMELDAAVLFTPEFSDKARGSVSELKTASRMMILARERGSGPKDLGIDMLVLKEKRRRETGTMPEKSIAAESIDMWHLDPAGCFKIEITNNDIREGRLYPGKIIAIHKKDSIAGGTAKEVLDTIIGLGRISRIDHAAYLGRELMRAELALKFNRSYSQDDKF
jgi:dihydropteroate synthase-like protein